MPRIRGTRSGARRTRAAASTPATDLRYVETSALLAALIEHDADAQRALQTPARYVTSALTFAEAGRGMLRARMARRMSAADEQAALRLLADLERRWFVVAVTRSVLERASRPFPIEPVRTLDGIHLATIEALAEAPQLVTVLSRDHRVCDNSRTLGYAIL